MKHLHRFVAVALVCAIPLFVGGCAKELQQAETFVQAITSSKVSQDSVIIARASFNTAQSVATNYLLLKRCNGSNGPICRESNLTQRIKSAVLNGRQARNNLTAFMKRNPGADVPVASYDALTTATSVINDLTAAYQAARGR